MDREFKVECIMISGKGKLVVRYGKPVKESQLNSGDVQMLIDQGAIKETEKSKKEHLKQLQKQAEEEKKKQEEEALKLRTEAEAKLKELDFEGEVETTVIKQLIRDLSIATENKQKKTLIEALVEYKSKLTDGSDQ